MESSSEFCYFENDRFPASEFTIDDRGRRIHERKPLHTVDGVVLKPVVRPLPPTVAPPTKSDE